jgi:hypothetical protein
VPNYLVLRASVRSKDGIPDGRDADVGRALRNVHRHEGKQDKDASAQNQAGPSLSERAEKVLCFQHHVVFRLCEVCTLVQLSQTLFIVTDDFLLRLQISRTEKLVVILCNRNLQVES